MKTLKLRIKDKHCKILDQLASEANFVWNYVNELCFKHLQRKGEFLSAYDIARAHKRKYGGLQHNITIVKYVPTVEVR